MPDYQNMYLQMAREVEKAIRILTDVQQKCEDIYIETSGEEIVMLPLNDTGAEEPE